MESEPQTIFVAGNCTKEDAIQSLLIANTLQGASLPNLAVIPVVRGADEWPATAEKISRLLGGGAVGDSVAWTDSGRLIGNFQQWKEWAEATYGVSVECSEEDIENLKIQYGAEARRDSLRRSMKKMERPETAALVLVDIQNDFCEGGALAVPHGDAIVPVANQMREQGQWGLVVLTQDFHPPDHVSFYSNNKDNPDAALFKEVELPDIGRQMMWPDHCVQGSSGAEFHPHLERSASDVIVRKGMHRDVDSYSGFGDAFGGMKEKTELEDTLKSRGVRDVFICGLAKDYCVSYTCKDARKAGFNVFLIDDATRGISEETISQEVKLMQDAGVHIIDSSMVPLRRPAQGVSARAAAILRDLEAGVSGFAPLPRRAPAALVIVDVQNDFCEPVGSLKVAGSSKVVRACNQLRQARDWDVVVLTQDFHPPDHVSFYSNNKDNPDAALFKEVELPEIGRQMMWPDHCVQGSSGAEFHEDLETAATDVIVRKGMHRDVDSYSGFGDAFGGAKEKTELEAVLRERGVQDVFVCGLAQDYCVAFTAKDAAGAGFNVFLVEDATAGVTPETVAAEMDRAKQAGVHLISMTDV